MVHQRQGLAFGFEPYDHLASIHPGFDNFERHLALHRFDLLGHVDYAKPAFPDLLQQLVASDPGTAWGLDRFGRRDFNSLVQEMARLIMSAKQAFYLGAQPGIALASNIQIIALIISDP